MVVLTLAHCDASDPLTEEPPPEQPPEQPPEEALEKLRIRLLGQVTLADTNQTHSDVWGYVDPVTSMEYALVGGLGTEDALFVVDVSDPTTPTLAATVTVPGFDIKVWQHYAYTVTGGGDNGGSPGGRIVDLSDPTNPQIVGVFPSSHNLFIDDRGFMYLEAPGLRIFDLNTDPTNPQLLWSSDPSGGHDATVVGTRLYDFHAQEGTFLYDVENPATPQQLGAITYPAIRHHHSGWPTEDGTHLFICDELARPASADITVWDIRNPAEPALVAEISDRTATVHNLYIIDDLAYVSYYTAGFRLYDVSDPADPRRIDEFDTAPGEFAPGIGGAWGIYPFTPSGTIYVSDIENGLFVFELRTSSTVTAP